MSKYLSERQKFDIEEQKREIMVRYNYRCQYPGCTRKALFIAHMIAKSDVNLKKYGPEIVHHPDLLKPVCEIQAHNDYFNIGNKPAVVAEKIAEIKEKEGWE